MNHTNEENDVKGNDKIIELLNDVLCAELTAVNQYWLHARMCQNWGFEALWTKIRLEAIDEMKHADQLVERILYLEGMPNLQRLGNVKVGEDVKEQLTLDVALEYEALERLSAGVDLCRELSDTGTRDLLEQILVSEEEHTDWLETQLEVIEKVGIQNYLAHQLAAGG